jgi:hypothetical protein
MSVNPAEDGKFYYDAILSPCVLRTGTFFGREKYTGGEPTTCPMQRYSARKRQ